MTFAHHHTIRLPPNINESCMTLSKPPPINELTDPELIVLPDPATIADNQLLSSILFPSPHPINDFSD